MKKFLIGLAIGIVLGGTGAYTLIKEKVTKVATKENAEKLVSAGKNLTNTVEEIVK